MNLSDQDLDQIPTLPDDITILDVSNNALQSLSNLPQTLVELDASYNELRDLRGITVCQQLKVLNVGHNKLTDIQPIQQCLELSQIVLSDNPGIQDLSILKDLPQLKTLYIKKLRCSIPQLSSLEALYCTIYDSHLPENLLKCRNLKTLHIHAQTLESIVGIEKLSQLQQLTIIGLTHVKDLTPLKACCQLKQLIWPHNR